MQGDTMPDQNEELQKILQLVDDEKRDESLFAFVERNAETDPDASVRAARSIKEYYKRGWALLICVKALVNIDMEKAEEVARTIEDEYNKLRSRQTIDFKMAKLLAEEGFDPNLN